MITSAGLSVSTSHRLLSLWELIVDEAPTPWQGMLLLPLVCPKMSEISVWTKLGLPPVPYILQHSVFFFTPGVSAVCSSVVVSGACIVLSACCRRPHLLHSCVFRSPKSGNMPERNGDGRVSCGHGAKEEFNWIWPWCSSWWRGAGRARAARYRASGFWVNTCGCRQNLLFAPVFWAVKRGRGSGESVRGRWWCVLVSDF